ncbi:unnamed protein product [Linum trigynum]|uniref:Uncharacterized protein n=1 Tax=Linum trigynum TaxID=586398 RepID=A0AAV2F392_9ROSI
MNQGREFGGGGGNIARKTVLQIRSDGADRQRWCGRRARSRGGGRWRSCGKRTRRKVALLPGGSGDCGASGVADSLGGNDGGGTGGVAG